MTASHGFSAAELAQTTADAEDRIAATEALRDDYIATFSTPAGVRVFQDLYVKCRQNRTTYSRGPDPHHSTFLEGRRSVVLDIMECLTLDDMEIIKRARNSALAG